ncbi:MAG: DMT family transporter [Anaerovoracaceae bacterium]|jgi:drug/metabolite transporter (DMT)-like permease
MSKKEIIIIMISALFFSTMEVALKIAGHQLDPFQLTFLRFALGGFFLLPFAIGQMRARQLKLTPGDLLYLFFLGIICTCISMPLLQIAVMNANANLVAIIICSNPVFISIFSHFIVEGERFTKRKALVLSISVIGLLILVNPFGLGAGNTVFGVLCGFGAAITFSLYSAVGKLRIGKIGDLALTSLSFLIGSAGLVIMILIMKKPILSGITPGNILIILYMGIGVTGLGYYFYFMAIHLSGPSNASFVFFLKAIFAPFIALLVLGEALRLNIAAGAALIILGSLITIRGARKDELILEESDSSNM